MVASVSNDNRQDGWINIDIVLDELGDLGQDLTMNMSLNDILEMIPQLLPRNLVLSSGVAEAQQKTDPWHILFYVVQDLLMGTRLRKHGWSIEVPIRMSSPKIVRWYAESLQVVRRAEGLSSSSEVVGDKYWNDGRPAQGGVRVLGMMTQHVGGCESPFRTALSSVRCQSASCRKSMLIMISLYMIHIESYQARTLRVLGAQSSYVQYVQCEQSHGVLLGQLTPLDCSKSTRIHVQPCRGFCDEYMHWYAYFSWSILMLQIR